jgi:hypothetical protein
MQKLIFLLFCICSFSSKSQDLEGGSEKAIRELRAKGVDTVVQFDNWYSRVASLRKVQGLGEIVLLQEKYLFYKLNGVGMAAKCIYYGDANGVTFHEVTSNPQKVNCDSLFRYVAFNFEKYKQDKIYPFVYKWKNERDSAYIYLWGSHPSDVSVVIDLPTQSYKKELRLDDVEELGIGRRVENLNYNYNSNTAIYKIYLMVQGLIEPIQEKFTYGK